MPEPAPSTGIVYEGYVAFLTDHSAHIGYRYAHRQHIHEDELAEQKERCPGAVFHRITERELPELKQLIAKRKAASEPERSTSKT